MNASVIVHLIGITALSAILVIVVLHTSSTMNVMIHDNIESKLKEATNVLALQIVYALNSGTNMTMRLEYPAMISYDKPYTIYIGSGGAIRNFLSSINLSTDKYYVVAYDPSQNIYVFQEIPISNLPYSVVFKQDPYVIASTMEVNLRTYIVGNTLYMDIEAKGVLIH